MGKMYEQIRETEMATVMKIDKAEYETAGEELAKEVFDKCYIKKKDEWDATNYFKKVYKEVEPEELDTYLLYKCLKAQQQTQKNTAVIKGILIGYAVLTLIGFLVVVL